MENGVFVNVRAKQNDPVIPPEMHVHHRTIRGRHGVDHGKRDAGNGVQKMAEMSVILCK